MAVEIGFLLMQWTSTGIAMAELIRCKNSWFVSYEGKPSW